MTKTHDVSKLPVWAQQKLKDAQNENEKLQRQLEIAQNASTGGETNIYVIEGLNDTTYLPEHTQIGFQLAEGFDNAVSVGLYTDAAGHRVLRVNGNSGISLTPRASNLIEIEMKPR